MPSDAKRFLRAVAAVIFLFVCAGAIASLYERAARPETATAHFVTVHKSVRAQGVVFFDEEYVFSPYRRAEALSPNGTRVCGGQSIFKTPQGEIAAPAAGFFTTELDGWEGVDFDRVQDLGSVRASVPENAIGKIMRGGWFFVCSPEGSCELEKGQELTIKQGERAYPAEVADIIGERVVLRARQGLEELLGTRKMSAEVVLCDVTGLKIPVSAVKKDSDGEYVTALRAGLSERCAVEVIYRSGDYVIVKQGELLDGENVLL